MQVVNCVYHFHILTIYFRDCPNYDLCEDCHQRLSTSSSLSLGPPFPLGTHHANHSMERIDAPPEVDPSTRILQLLLAATPGDPDVAAMLLELLTGGPKKPPTKRSVLDGLPVVTATLPLINSLDDQSCAICMGDFLVGDRLTCLPCGHHFHMPAGSVVGEDECGGVVSWLQQCNECPLCRYQLEAEPSPASSQHMSQPWICPGCDARNPGDDVAGRDARCACGVNRNVCVLLSRSGHLRQVEAACDDLYRRIIALPHTDTNDNARAGLIRDIERFVSSEAITSLVSQGWDIKDHLEGLLRSILDGSNRFPIVMMCQNSRAVVRHLHMRLERLHLSDFTFHIHPTSASPTEHIYPPSYQPCFPLLDATRVFISQNYRIFEEIAILASTYFSLPLWTRMMECILPTFEANNWTLSDPLRKLGQGERSLAALVSELGVDLGTIAVVENLLVQILVIENKPLPQKSDVASPMLDVLCEVISSGGVSEPWDCPGCDTLMEAKDEECKHCHVKKNVIRRSLSPDVKAVVEELKRVYVEVLEYRTAVATAPDDTLLRNVKSSISALDANTQLVALEEAGWELRAHFISMFEVIVAGGNHYPIYGLDRNSRALIRIVHRQLANVHPHDVSFFDLDLSKTTSLALPDTLFRTGAYEAAVRGNVDVFDEISGDIAYSCTEHRYSRLIPPTITTLEGLGWRLQQGVEQMRRDHCRDISELSLSNVDSNSRGMLEVILFLVNEREAASGIVRRRRRITTPASSSGTATSAPSASSDKSWFRRFFGW